MEEQKEKKMKEKFTTEQTNEELKKISKIKNHQKKKILLKELSKNSGYTVTKLKEQFAYYKKEEEGDRRTKNKKRTNR